MHELIRIYGSILLPGLEIDVAALKTLMLEEKNRLIPVRPFKGLGKTSFTDSIKRFIRQ